MALQLSLIKFNGGSYEKKQNSNRKYLGEKVQIELFDGDILTGFLQKNWS